MSILTEEEKEQEPLILRIKEILESKHIAMNVRGCGCCGSPCVSFSYKGEVIADELDYVNFTMIEKEDK